MSVNVKRKVRVLAVGDPAVYTYTSPKFGLIEQWSRKTGIELDFSILSWSDYYLQLMSALQSDTPEYDIVMIPGHLWLDDFVSRGYLKSLDSYIDLLPEEYNYNDLLPTVQKEMVSDDSVYLVPSFTDGHMLYYFKDKIIEATGRGLPEVISTREYVDLIKKISERFPEENAVAFKAHESEIFLDWLPWLRSMGGNVFDENMNIIVNSPEAVRALDAYLECRRYAPADTNLYGNEEIKNSLRTGKVSMAVSWGGQAGFIMSGNFNRKEEISFATFDRPWNVTWSFAVPQAIEVTEEVRDFLTYISGKDVDRIVGANAGSPVRDSSYALDSEIYPWYKVQKKMTELSETLPGFSGSSDIYGVLYTQLSRAYTGEISAEQALNQAVILMKQRQEKLENIC